MKNITACAILSAILLATAMPSAVHAKKFNKAEIGAKETCRKDNAAAPLSKCMAKYAKEFCTEKGFKDYKAVNWTSSGGGYYVPSSINCS
jgi:hypothetical protein